MLRTRSSEAHNCAAKYFLRGSRDVDVFTMKNGIERRTNVYWCTLTMGDQEITLDLTTCCIYVQFIR